MTPPTLPPEHNMNDINYTVTQNPFYDDEFKTFVRNVVKKGAKSLHSWLASSWNKSLAALATAYSHSSNSAH